MFSLGRHRSLIQNKTNFLSPYIGKWAPQFNGTRYFLAGAHPEFRVQNIELEFIFSRANVDERLNIFSVRETTSGAVANTDGFDVFIRTNIESNRNIVNWSYSTGSSVTGLPGALGGGNLQSNNVFYKYNRITAVGAQEYLKIEYLDKSYQEGIQSGDPRSDNFAYHADSKAYMQITNTRNSRLVMFKMYEVNSARNRIKELIKLLPFDTQPDNSVITWPNQGADAPAGSDFVFQSVGTLGTQWFQIT